MTDLREIGKKLAKEIAALTNIYCRDDNCIDYVKKIAEIYGSIISVYIQMYFLY